MRDRREELRLTLTEAVLERIDGSMELSDEELRELIEQRIRETAQIRVISAAERVTAKRDVSDAFYDWLLAYLDPQDAQAVYSGYAFHVMSHEEGSTIQKMLAAVVREPERPSIATTAYQLPEENEEYRVSTVAESGEYSGETGRRKRGGIRGILSFFSGISVLLILFCALAWAMG